jgi:ppGpp synthetase/RelA/SpoT-type nucleotidyltranferase
VAKRAQRRRNWFGKINDTVRTCLMVKYLDGVEFLSGKLDYLCSLHNVDCRVDYEAKEEGYYAAHVYARQNFEIPSKKWGTEKADVDVEIQITTQLQEVIRQLLHKYYESRRAKPESKRVTWQWDYRSEEFAANYLGHILHYVEGMIVDIRDKQAKEKNP